MSKTQKTGLKIKASGNKGGIVSRVLCHRGGMGATTCPLDLITVKEAVGDTRESTFSAAMKPDGGK